MNDESLLAHAGFVRAIARSLVNDESRVDDIVQETWLAALKNPPRHRRSIRAWLGTIALNVARSTLRSDTRRVKREKRVAVPEGLPSTAEIADSRSMIRLVVDAVTNLDEPYASTIVMRYYEDLTPAEIAQRQEIPVETVRTRLKRANARIRKQLDHEFHGDRRAWCLALVPLLRPGSTVAPAAAGGAGFAARIAALAGGKLVASLALMLAMIAAVWWLFFRTGDLPGVIEAGDPAIVASSMGRVADLSALPEAADATAAPVIERDAVDEAEFLVPEDLPGSLAVRVTWADDGLPAAGVRAAVGGADLVVVLGTPLDLVSDEQGWIVVDDLEPGMAVVHFDRIPGFGYAEIRPGERSELSIEVPPGADLFGLVSDAAGRPIAGAEVYLCREPWDPGQIIATTGDDGTYSLRDLSIGGFVGARGYGFLPSRKRYIPKGTVRGIQFDFALAASFGSIAGKVYGADGELIEGAMVRLRASGSLDDRRPVAGAEYLAPPAVRLASHATGEFEYDGFDAGTYHVDVSADGYQRWVGQADLTNQAEAFLEVRLSRGTPLVGVVRDGAGDPVPGALIRARGEGDTIREEIKVHADDNGVYRFESLMTGLVTVRAEGPGNTGRAMTELRVESQPELGWDPVLDTSLELHGVVLDHEGNPLGGYEVFAGIPSFDLDRFYQHATMHNFSWMRKDGGSGGYFDLDQIQEGLLRRFRSAAVTGADGRFVIANCDDRAYPVEVFEPDQESSQPCAWADGVRPGAGEVILRVLPVNRASSYLIGRVVDGDDEPIAGVKVRLRSPERHYWRAEATTRRDGSFRCGPLTSIPFHVVLEHGDYGRNAMDDVKLEPEEERDLGTIVLYPTGTFEAKIVREDGEDFGTPHVWLFDEHRTVRTAVTLEEDMVRSGELAPGRYLLCIHGHGNSQVAWMEYPLVIRPGQHTSEVVEVQSGVLRTVRVLPALEHPFIVGKVEAKIRDRDGNLVAVRRFPRSTGIAELGFDVVLEPGRYTVRVASEGGLYARQQFEISKRSGADEPLEIRMVDPTAR